MASMGHSGSHRVQSMHSSGSMTRKFGPSWKQSTGHTSTQSMYLHLMQFSVTTKVIPNTSLSASLCHRLRIGATAQLREVVPVEACSTVLEVAPQRVIGAGEGNVRPRDLLRGHELRLEALDAYAILGLGELRAEEHMHLMGLENA